jgi:regulator of protease activity HflC (stomatin/prohibitin superfamily)
LYRDDEVGGFPLIGKIISGAVVVAILFSILGFFIFTTRVEAGEACVKLNFGKVDGYTGPGLHLRNPIGTKYRCLTTRKQTYETVAGDPKKSDSKADYTDWAVNGKTNEGIDFEIYFTVQYHMPVDQVGNVYLNYKTDERVVERVVKFHTRTIVPQTLNTYSAEQLYLGDLGTISNLIEGQLQPLFEANGIVLDYFELKRGDFDDSYEQAIRDKALKVEEAKRKALDQEVASETAKAQKITAEGDATALKIKAQGEADAAVIKAQGDATAEKTVLDARAAAISAHPELITWESIGAIQSANVIYLPSDSGILPILSLNPSADGTPTAVTTANAPTQ